MKLVPKKNVILKTNESKQDETRMKLEYFDFY